MENIRTSKQLLIVVITELAISVFFFAALYYLRIFGRKFSEFFSISFDFVAAAAAILLPVLFMTTHPRMRHLVKRHLGFRKKKIAFISLDRFPIRKMSESVAKDEANRYFEYLAKTWSLKK
ncbi:hypothetical protein L596_013982 [Steinernema carpocapsae]|nr:hypothetical protein L596_013982 [Steinernema carpocapsae]